MKILEISHHTLVNNIAISGLNLNELAWNDNTTKHWSHITTHPHQSIEYYNCRIVDKSESLCMLEMSLIPSGYSSMYIIQYTFANE